MKTHFLLAGLCLALATTACQTTGSGSDSPAEVEAVLRAQESAWNDGDIEGFMSAGYWNSQELTFLSGGSWTTGYEPVLARYRKRYVEGDGEMGNLVFSRLDVLLLERDVSMARGHWQLTFADGEGTGGLFTLILRRLPEGWRVVHDHTSLDS
jgi:ketosteroid isomerase-like protein